MTAASPLPWLALLLALAMPRESGAAAKRVWKPIGPETLGETVLVTDPENPARLRAGTHRGVLTSSDGGESWSASATSLASERVNSLAIDPSDDRILYAATSSGLFKTTDGGATWSRSNAGIANGPMADVVVDPQAPSTIYLRGGRPSIPGPDNRVFKSIDGGVTWHPSSDGLLFFGSGPGDAITLNALTLDPRRAGTLYVHVTAWKCSGPSGNLCSYAADAIFKTTDGAATWAPVGDLDQQPPGSTIAVPPDGSMTVYAGGNGGVFKSSDGATWFRTSLEADSGVVALTIDPASPSTVYAGTFADEDTPARAFRSTDGGATWVPLGLTTNSSIRIAVPGPKAPSTLYAATQRGGVFKSTDGGMTWKSANGRVSNVAIPSLAVEPQEPHALYAVAPGDGVFVTTDRGATWARRTEEDIQAVAVVSASPGGFMYAVTKTQILASNTGGTSWTTDFNGVSCGRTFCDSPWELVSVVADPSRRGVAIIGACTSGDNAIFRLAGDDEVVPARSRLASLSYIAHRPNGPCTAPLLANPRQKTTFYAGTTSGAVFESVDGGDTWSQIGSNLPAAVTSLAMDRRRRATLYAGTAGLGVFRSNDGGRTWQPSGPSNVYVEALAVDPRSQSRVFAAVRNDGVFVSPNRGKGWRSVNEGLTSRSPRSLTTSSGRRGMVYLGTSEGVFELTIRKRRRQP